jgi:hypothetical protein
MKKDRPSALCDGTDKALGDTVLPVSANGTEAKTLMAFHAVVLKSPSSVDAVVSTYRIYANVVACCLSSKFLFRFDKLVYFLGVMKSSVDKA